MQGLKRFRCETSSLSVNLSPRPPAKMRRQVARTVGKGYVGTLSNARSDVANGNGSPRYGKYPGEKHISSAESSTQLI